MQQALDEELNAVLTPTEKAEIGRVEADYLFELEEIENFPNDPQVNNQWEIGAVLSQFESHFNTQASTSERIVVAMIDSGVDYTHEDLVGHFYNPATCFDETGTTTPDGCPFGGWDFVDDDNDPSPKIGETHGTRIAGLIAAQSDSNLGIASLSNNLVDLMPIRVTSGTQIELSKIVDAIYFAVENGADVINMSFAGPTFSQTLEDAIDYAGDNGVIVVAAAGNYGTDNDIAPIYPAS
jgi:subtilisin family serine protease